MRFKQLKFVNTKSQRNQAFVKYGKYDLSIIKNECMAMQTGYMRLQYSKAMIK